MVKLAGATGLEPATSCVTGRRSSQLNYAPANEPSGLAVPCTVLAQHGYRELRCPGTPGRSRIRLIVKLANSWQIGFLRDLPQKGKSENSRVFIGDFDGGPGGLEPPTSPLSGAFMVLFA